jgi:hypothetical protein
LITPAVCRSDQFGPSGNKSKIDAKQRTTGFDQSKSKSRVTLNRSNLQQRFPDCRVVTRDDR